ncbi:MAG: SPX domain-containing protein [Thermoplasmatota archaeon]
MAPTLPAKPARRKRRRHGTKVRRIALDEETENGLDAALAEARKYVPDADEGVVVRAWFQAQQPAAAIRLTMMEAQATQSTALNGELATRLARSEKQLRRWLPKIDAQQKKSDRLVRGLLKLNATKPILDELRALVDAANRGAYPSASNGLLNDARRHFGTWCEVLDAIEHATGTQGHLAVYRVSGQPGGDGP